MDGRCSARSTRSRKRGRDSESSTGAPAAKAAKTKKQSAAAAAKAKAKAEEEAAAAQAGVRAAFPSSSSHDTIAMCLSATAMAVLTLSCRVWCQMVVSRSRSLVEGGACTVELVGLNDPAAHSLSMIAAHDATCRPRALKVHNPTQHALPLWTSIPPLFPTRSSWCLTACLAA